MGTVSTRSYREHSLVSMNCCIHYDRNTTYSHCQLVWRYNSRRDQLLFLNWLSCLLGQLLWQSLYAFHGTEPRLLTSYCKLLIAVSISLQARIAFLQGERKGQENLKQDLVRRIKMLEFALRQERAKYQKLQYGVEQTQQQAVNNGTQSSEGKDRPAVKLVISDKFDLWILPWILVKCFIDKTLRMIGTLCGLFSIPYIKLSGK